jgi:hypothetical protein
MTEPDPRSPRHDDPDAPERAALDRLLDAYGGDRARWPAAMRLRVAGLVARDAVARRMVAEAAAFDRLLATAAPPDPARADALLDRIVAAAATEGRPTARPGRPSTATAERVAMAALLAASLVVGVGAGLSGLTTPAVDVVVALWTEEDGDLTLLGDDAAPEDQI